MQQRCLILSPHIDDAAFSLGAALMEGRFAGATVITVFSRSNCTAGDYDADVDGISRRRRNEDDAFFARASNCRELERLYLGRDDAPLRLGIPDIAVFAVPVSEPDKREIDYMAGVLRAHLRDVTLLVVPLALGRHIDHLVVQYAVRAVEALEPPLAFYEDLPYAGRLPLAVIEEEAKKTGLLFQTRLIPHLLRSRGGGAEKIRALGTYQSQLDPDTTETILQHGLRLGNDRLAERLWCSESATPLIQNRG